ncbi:MAG TPA: MFS transporter [Thermomicrobiales bacterium]|nr:MFS transporter [Thermomicrobiales bacterium]
MASAVVRVRERARGVFYGWYIVLAASGIQLLQTGLLMQAYGSYVVVLQSEFGWSKTALAAAFSLQRVESGLIGPIQGWMLERWGPRAVMRAGTIIFGLGFMAFSQVDSLIMFYLTFLMMALGSSLGGFISLTSSIVNWFERRRATALGITQVGMSVGGIMAPLVAWSLLEFGWRATAFGSGVLVIVIGLPLVQVMRDAPEKYGLRPDGEPPDAVRSETVTIAGVEHERADFTARQAMRTRAFWFISIGHALALLVVSSVMVHLVAHLKEGLGFSLTAAATVLAFMTAVTMVGQVVGGFLGDRFDKRMITTLAMFGHSGALLALAWGGNLFWVLVFAVVNGLAWGMRGPLMQAIRADYFGRKSFAMVMGFSSMIVMWGMMSGPIIAGAMADYFGNYQWGFTVLAVLAGCGSVFFILATKPTPPRERWV